MNETAIIDSVEITVKEIKITLGDDSAITLNPQIEGRVYVGIKVLINNSKSSDLTISSLICFEAKYNSEKVTYSLFSVSLFGGSLDSTIASNDSLVGWYAIQLPSDWTEFSLTFRLDLFSSNIAKFIIKNTDATA